MRTTWRGRQGEVELDDQVLTPFRERLASVPDTGTGATFRLCFAALHVVMRPEYSGIEHSLEQPGSADEIGEFIDWPATGALRRRLDALGFGIAEAMDTAQRFFLGWQNARRLIRECGALELKHGFVAGAGADHVERVTGPGDLVEGVVEQAREIQAAGGLAMLLPLPWLSRSGASEQQYVDLYTAIIDRLDGPLFVHWLGSMFLPELDGYFPGDSFRRIMAHDPERVRGAKLSLLDPPVEVGLRRELLARDQLLLTGDDFHFGELIRGGDPASDRNAPAASAASIERTTELAGRRVALGDFSHALLGVLDGVAEPAAVALGLLSRGDAAGYRELMSACELLGRKLFEVPTRHYKVGLAFLSWLNGDQDNRMLVNHEELRRDIDHLLEVARLASVAGVIRDTGTTASRLDELR